MTGAPLYCVCLDFDGTIMEYEGDRGWFHPAVIECLNTLEKLDVRWFTNSGRGIKNQLEVLDLSVERGLRHMPEKMLCGESFIYDRQGESYTDREPWNTKTREFLRSFHADVQQRLSGSLETWMEKYSPKQTYVLEEATVFLVDPANNQPQSLAGEMAGMLADMPHAEVQINGGYVFVIPDFLGKGAILKESLLHDRALLDRTLAIGNDYNDIPMLDGKSAGLTGCPGDAVAGVIREVRRSGGYAASAPGPLGSVEVIKHHLQKSGKALEFRLL
ncbi:MAG: HAD hydrolase family protein [Kiritimatiellia bacterium]